MSPGAFPICVLFVKVYVVWTADRPASEVCLLGCERRDLSHHKGSGCMCLAEVCGVSSGKRKFGIKCDAYTDHPFFGGGHLQGMARDLITISVVLLARSKFVD